MHSSLQMIFLFLALIIGVVSSDNICDLPEVVGPCKASIKRFYYQSITGQCKRFLYSGCEGNNNNFKTRRDCVTACRKRVCTFPKVTTLPIPAFRPGWFYNAESMACERYRYGREKRWNTNNLRTRQRCERVCKGVMKNPCGPNPGCAPPPPPADVCPGSIYEIINGEKCFTGCTYPKCKKGSCPSIPALLPCHSRCINDQQCTGDQLCCQQGCCRDPVLEPKNGDCPEDPRPRNCSIIRPSECHLDGQCDGRRKCCKFGCRKFCVDAIDQHESLCDNFGTIKIIIDDEIVFIDYGDTYKGYKQYLRELHELIKQQDRHYYKINVYSMGNICDLPKVVGPCRARLPRFHYDVKTGRCKKFFYGGCSGNENNFKTRQDCLTTCKKRVCTLPKLIGTGQLSVSRWFYNVEIMKCEKFIYRGGQGNKNNFRNKRKCERLCKGIKKDTCGPIRDCAKPLPGTCAEPIYEFINGEKCFVGCRYPMCNDVKLH